MLTRTFQHVPRIGPKTERRFWQSGITDWRTCLGRLEELPLGPGRKRVLTELLERSLAALEAEDAEFFARRLPSREFWRLYGAFCRRAVCLDIETTGLGAPRDLLTVVGLYDGRRARVFVRGINLDEFADAIGPYCLVVTYNGAQFDLPFIRRVMPQVTLPAAHLDLRFPLARLGYRGGLKGVEQAVGLSRHPWVEGLDGFDAVLLWRAYEKGDREALRRLIAYNLADVINLRPLAAFLHNEMVVQYAGEHGLGAYAPLVELPQGVLYDRLVLDALQEVGLAQ